MVNDIMLFSSINSDKKTYKVKKGDTLYSIAKANGISTKELMSENNMKDGEIISIGRILTIPSNSRKQESEIGIMPEIPQKQLERLKYLDIKENGSYKVKSGDTISIIAKKYKVEPITILKLNGLNETSILSLGQYLKIPPSRIAKNIKNLDDAAKALGISSDFVLKMKRLEDGPNKKDNEFHNEYYYDGSGNKKEKIGNKTIGIGHLWHNGEPEKLTNGQVLSLYVKDMLKAEDHLKAVLGEKKFDNMPAPVKEALLDMVFNKGSNIIKNSKGFVEDLKNARYDDAICKMTNNKDNKGNELSGLSKRRLFDMAVASEYKKPVSPKIIAKAQQVYNNGVNLLKKEYGDKYIGVLAGFNKDIQNFWGDKIKYLSK